MSRKSPADLQIEDDERHGDDVADYIQRNRKALNASIKRSRRELAEGKSSKKTIGEIIAEGKTRYAKKS